MYRKILSWRSVEVEMRNGEMGVKYVKDGAVGWTPVVRRKKKSARSEASESSGNLNVNDKRRSLVRYNRKVDRTHPPTPRN